jgi:predicted MFS family arabinose efflux permease
MVLDTEQTVRKTYQIAEERGVPGRIAAFDGQRERRTESMPTVDAHVASPSHRQRNRSGFWPVAYALLIVMAFATLPSPLYGLYRSQDHLSALMITVVFAISAGGIITVLLVVPRIAARVGRRRVMLGAVATMMVAASLLAAQKGLTVLIIGRLLTGVAVGLAAGTAIAYLIELRLRADPMASMVGARNIGTSVTVGALGVGPLISGSLAEWVGWPLTVPYLVFLGLGAVGIVRLWFVPETGTTALRATASDEPTRSRPAKLPFPAAAGTLAAFAASGLFAGLAGLILAMTLADSSRVLAGATLFLMFSCGVASQLATTKLHASSVLALGTISMVAGLVLLVVSVHLSAPSLALFLLSGALIGAGDGAVFKGTTGIVLEAAAPESRLAMTSKLLVALYVGLSIPVVGAGVALNQGVSIPNTVLGFAILVALGVTYSGWALLRHRQPSVTKRDQP